MRLYFVASLPDCVANSEMMLRNGCSNCDIILTKARTLSQFIERQSRGSDNSAAHILKKQELKHHHNQYVIRILSRLRSVDDITLYSGSGILLRPELTCE